MIKDSTDDVGIVNAGNYSDRAAAMLTNLDIDAEYPFEAPRLGYSAMLFGGGQWLVSGETRKVCLGHTNGDITTHYSAPEIAELMDAFEKLCDRREGIVLRPTLGIVGGYDVSDSRQKSRRSHAGLVSEQQKGGHT